MLEKSFGAPAHHQGRRHRRQNRASRQVREHGRADGEEVASKTADVAGDGTTTATVLAPVHRHRGHEVRRRRHEPDGPQARHRQGGGRRRRGTERRSASPAPPAREIAQVGSSRPTPTESIGKTIAEAMDKVGKEGVITVGTAGPRERARRGRGHAVRPRLHLAVLHQQPDKADRGHSTAPSSSRQEDQQHPRPPAAARAGGEGRQAAAHHRRGRRGRGARHARRQPSVAASRSPPSRRRASAIAAKAMLEDIAILTGGTVIAEELGIKLEKRDAGGPGPRQARRGAQRKTPRSSTAPGEGRHQAARQEHPISSRSRKRPATTTREAAGACREARGRCCGDQRSAPRPRSR